MMSLIKSIFKRAPTYAAALFLTFLGPSLGFAKNDFKNPTVFNTFLTSRLSLYENCSLVAIYSVAKHNGNLYSQKGVGWVVKSDEGFRILTPSHVVVGAESIKANCYGKEIPLRLQSQSQTLDIALLTIEGGQENTENLFPLILFRNRTEFLNSLDKQTASDFAWHARDQFSKPWGKILASQIETLYKAPLSDEESKLYGTTLFEGQTLSGQSQGKTVFDNTLNSLRINNIAIKPGFSGSPAYVTNRGQFSKKEGWTSDDEILVGMLTKTEINGTRSLGISLPQILNVMPALLASNNPAQDVYTTANKIPVRLVYKLIPTATSLERHQVLIDERNPNNKTTYFEVCNDTAAASSEWNFSNKINGNDKLNGGSTPKNQELTPNAVKVSSKATAVESKEKSKIKNLLEEPAKNELQSKESYYQEQKLGGGDYGEGGGGSTKSNQFDPKFLIYRAGSTCKKSYITSDKGTTFDSIQLQGKSIKTTNVYELFNAWVFPSSGSEQVCQSMTINAIQDSYSYSADAKSVRFYSDRAPFSTSAQRYITCQNDGFRINTVMGSVAIVGDFSDKESPKGAYVASLRCTDKIAPAEYISVNRWKKIIRTKNFDMDIIFGNFGEYLSIKTLRVSPECASNGFNSIHGELIIK